MEIINELGPNKLLELNAKLAQKKSKLRKELKEKGILKKDRVNDFDRYAYFSEAGYKKLFTELFSNNDLELTSTEIAVHEFETNSSKQPTGRQVTLKFILTDIETGFYEESLVTGEGIDKGDKAIYKAYTGALKYYLANTFMVATGNDAEAESPQAKRNEDIMPELIAEVAKLQTQMNKLGIDWRGELDRTTSDWILNKSGLNSQDIASLQEPQDCKNLIKIYNTLIKRAKENVQKQKSKGNGHTEESQG